MSKYLAYPFLYDKSCDLRCDFEILTDEISSMIGLLRAYVEDSELKDELSKVNELMYHLNPSLRTKTTVTEEELIWLEQRYIYHSEYVKERFNKFVLPEGSRQSGFCHVIRSKCKALVRLTSRYKERGNNVDEIIFDFANLFSGYFFVLALKFNKDENIEETEFISRNYK